MHFNLIRRIVTVVILASAISACRSEDVLRASYAVRTDTLKLYALELEGGGDPDLSLPNGLNVLGSPTQGLPPLAIPAIGMGTFDVGFEIIDDTSVSIVPVRNIIPIRENLGYPVSNTQVGVEVEEVDFEDIDRAPEIYYRPDTVTQVTVGTPFILQVYRSTGAVMCYYMVSPRVYAKIVIDSVDVSAGSIYLRQTMNPNCGYRSFLPGVPSN